MTEVVIVSGVRTAIGNYGGARIIVTLIYEMMCQDFQFGLGTLCIGGGQGMAIIIERKR